MSTVDAVSGEPLLPLVSITSASRAEPRVAAFRDRTLNAVGMILVFESGQIARWTFDTAAEVDAFMGQLAQARRFAFGPAPEEHESQLDDVVGPWEYLPFEDADEAFDEYFTAKAWAEAEILRAWREAQS